MVLMHDRPWILREAYFHFAEDFAPVQEPSSFPTWNDIRTENQPRKIPQEDL